MAYTSMLRCGPGSDAREAEERQRVSIYSLRGGSQESANLPLHRSSDTIFRARTCRISLKSDVPVSVRARNQPYGIARRNIVHANGTHFSATRLLRGRSSYGLSGHLARICIEVVLQIRTSPECDALARRRVQARMAEIEPNDGFASVEPREKYLKKVVP